MTLSQQQTSCKELLIHSQTFCHASLEKHVGKWRCALGHAVHAAAIDVKDTEIEGSALFSRP
eukprot:4715274-Amphidinium_carterae.1